MKQQEFEEILDKLCYQLTLEARSTPFKDSRQFEQRVREALITMVAGDSSIAIDLTPPNQAFPDIAVGAFGVEVKFTLNDTWRSVANSVLETNRVESVEYIYIVFGKMGGLPEVRWGRYEDTVMHVRTSHVPRFEVDLDTPQSLFQELGISYDEFRILPMEQKMQYIRRYARGRLKKGERLWWLEDNPDEGHTLPIQARLYTSLSSEEKTRLRAEATLLCPGVVRSGRSRNKYDDAVLYLLTYRGVLTHQARDLFSAGSVANPDNDDEGGIYIARALKLLEEDMIEAAQRLPDALFEEYWGESVEPKDRVAKWLEKADELAQGWVPSEVLFKNMTR